MLYKFLGLLQVFCLYVSKWTYIHFIWHDKLYIYFLYTPTLFPIIFLYFLLLPLMLMQENHHNRIPPFLRNVYGCLTSFHITRVHCTLIVNKNFISLQYKLKTRKFTLLFGLVLILDLSWAKIMIASLFGWYSCGVGVQCWVNERVAVCIVGLGNILRFLFHLCAMELSSEFSISYFLIFFFFILILFLEYRERRSFRRNFTYERAQRVQFFSLIN